MSFANLKKYMKAKTAKVLASFVAILAVSACVDIQKSPTVDLSQPVKVALMVPSGGSNAAINQIGESILKAAKLADSELNTNDIQLLVFKTGGNESTAANMALQAKEQGAHIILGPLKSIEANAVANAVPDIPMWTFSNNAEIAGENTYVFGTTFDVIANRVVKFAKSQGSSTLGIIATDDLGGNQGLIASKNAANQHGMRVVYEANYPLSVAGIEANAPGIAAALKASGAQSVMFTDTPSGGLGIMANALAAQGYSSNSSQYLGLSRWDEHSSFLKQAQLEGGYFAVPDLGAANAFNARFKSVYGENAHSLAGLGYDGVAAIISLVKTAKSKNDRTPFGANDIKGTGFNGVMGAFRFDRNNHANRALAVMQVSGGTAVLVSPAASSM